MLWFVPSLPTSLGIRVLPTTSWLVFIFILLFNYFSGFKPPYQCAEVDNAFLNSEPIYTNGSIYLDYDKCQIYTHLNDTNATFIRSQDCVNGHAYSVPKDRTFVTEVISIDSCLI